MKQQGDIFYNYFFFFLIVVVHVDGAIWIRFGLGSVIFILNKREIIFLLISFYRTTYFLRFSINERGVVVFVDMLPSKRDFLWPILFSFHVRSRSWSEFPGQIYDLLFDLESRKLYIRATANFQDIIII